MKVLVTGGAGFQGVHLCRSLIGEGHAVTILNTPSERAKKNVFRSELVDTAQVVWGSVTDRELIRRTVPGHDLVYHLAANIHVDESRREPLAYIQGNVFGTFQVLEACREHNVPLVHVSSCEVYGACNLCRRRNGCDKRIDEACSFKPQSPYAASKASADCLAYSYSVTFGLPIVILRPGNVFGPGQRSGDNGAVIPRFTDLAIKGQPITIYGDGQQTRDFVYVKDVVRAYLFAAEWLLYCQPEQPLVLNVSQGRPIRIIDVATSIIRTLESPSVIEHKAERPGEVSAFRLDSSRLTDAGFRWDWTFETGLEDYFLSGAQQ